MVKNLPSNSGDMCSVPGQGIKIPHDQGQLSLYGARLHAPTREKPACNERSHMPQVRANTAKKTKTKTKKTFKNETFAKMRTHDLKACSF